MATPKKDDLGQAEVKSAREKARKQGYEGSSPATIPNKEFTLSTGPDSPSAANQLAAIAEQRGKEIRGTVTESGS